jgi:hypothetical protein
LDEKKHDTILSELEERNSSEAKQFFQHLVVDAKATVIDKEANGDVPYITVQSVSRTRVALQYNVRTNQLIGRVLFGRTANVK